MNDVIFYLIEILTCKAIFHFMVDARTNVLYNEYKQMFWMRERSIMANLLEITTLYHELSFIDRIIFYITLSNDVAVCAE